MRNWSLRKKAIAILGTTALGAGVMLVGAASADTSALHTVVIAPSANIGGCAITNNSCVPKYVAVSAPADSFPALKTVAVAECNFGDPDDPPDPGLCDNKAGHSTFTHTEADGSLKFQYDNNNNNLGALKIPLTTGTIGSAHPVLGGTPNRPDAICPPTNAMRAVGRDCGVVVAVIESGAITHIGAAVEWFAATMTGPTSGASNVDITLNGDKYGTLASRDPLVCAANGMPMTGSPASCMMNEAVRIYNGTRLIGAAIVGSHGQWTTNVHIPARASGQTYEIIAKGAMSGLSKKLVYTVS